jgi:phosphoadenosine phosphosulfate reductase
MAGFAIETAPARAGASHQQSHTSRAGWVPMKDRAVEGIQRPTGDVVALPNRRSGPTSAPPATPAPDLDWISRELDGAGTEAIVQWAASAFADRLVMSTSFGIHSAALLHLVTRVVPEIPVVWVDTGYLPAETYRFVDELSDRLMLNLKVYQSPISPARMEALDGRPWERDDSIALDRYHQIRKIEPMQRALQDLGATAWLAGLRAEQTDHRKSLREVHRQWGRLKVLPMLRWTIGDVHEYLQTHDLPYHPLFERGYTSVGDWHSSRPIEPGDTHERVTRFHGLRQECGLHSEGLA